MLEKEIEKKVHQHGKTLGIGHYKFASPARAAVPDRLFVYRGQLFFIEFKKTGKKPTPAQLREHVRLREQGATVFVVDSVEQGKSILDKVAEGTPLKDIRC